MKKTLLKLLASVGLLVSANAATLTTNWTDATGHPAFLLSTNRASVYSVILAAPANSAVTISFYDSDSLSQPYFGTNYTNMAFTYYTPTSGATYVTSYVGYNGITNWYTNVGIRTGSNYQAVATNVLPVMGAFSAGAGQTVVYNTDMLFAEGISVVPSTNGTVTVNYRSGQ